MKQKLSQVTERIITRSAQTRTAYLDLITRQNHHHTSRRDLSKTNFAHGAASATPEEKMILRDVQKKPNIGIISAYNDILSAHQPLNAYPELIKKTALKCGAVAQFAGGVPAMCDGVTQGQKGMELSLFSRDVIAMSASIALSHQLFDGVLMLGVCDKIVPGLLIAALRYGHLPAIFVPGGPMQTGIGNEEKAQVRQAYAEGKISDDELLSSEMKAYHNVGTCTFYGTANTNQMLMEVLGLHVPGSAFIPPSTLLRQKLVEQAAQDICSLTVLSPHYCPIGKMIDEKSIVNAIVTLMATGGSTNHTIHLIAIASACGIQITWDDFHDISTTTPLLCQIYPNGTADVNAFHEAGGTALLIRQLLESDLLHDDVMTVAGKGLTPYTRVPHTRQGELEWIEAPAQTGDSTIIAPTGKPFRKEGGIRLLTGNLGRAIIKVSAMPEPDVIVRAPAKVFDSQEAMIKAFQKGELTTDFVAVLPHQGPSANGMPELHQLTPILTSLQKRGLKVAMVTDGRMSGASGKVPAAIHLTPECAKAGVLGLIQNGDIIELNLHTNTLNTALSDQTIAARNKQTPQPQAKAIGLGRELFDMFRHQVTSAEKGAHVFGDGLAGDTPLIGDTE